MKFFGVEMARACHWVDKKNQNGSSGPPPSLYDLSNKKKQNKTKQNKNKQPNKGGMPVTELLNKRTR